MVELTIEEKIAYVERIEAKAKNEGISIKYATQKLGGKAWAYYKYKTEIKQLAREQSRLEPDNREGGAVVEPATVKTISEPNQITLCVSDDVMCYLEKEAEGYATEPAIVAQLLLHDVVRQKVKAVKQ